MGNGQYIILLKIAGVLVDTSAEDTPNTCEYHAAHENDKKLLHVEVLRAFEDC